MAKNICKELQNVYGDKLNKWHDISFEQGDEEQFAYSTLNGTVIYGIDLENGGFFAAFTTEPHFMEFEPRELHKFKNISEAKKKALEILKKIK